MSECDVLRGLIVPYDIEADAAETTAVADGRHTGRTTPTSVAGAMGVRSRRRDNADSTVDGDPSIVVRTNRGGLPAPAETAAPATFLWRYGDETDEDLRGWEHPWTLQRYAPAVTDGAAPVSSSDAVPWGEGYAVAWRQLTATPTYGIRVQFNGADSAVTGAGATTVVALSTTRVFHPCLVVVRGRLHVYWWEEFSSSDTPSFVTGWVVAGAVWNEETDTWDALGFVTPVDDAILQNDSLDMGPDQIRAAAIDDTVVIVGNFREDEATAITRSHDKHYVVQWRSSDGGYSFEYRGIQTTDSASGPAAMRLDIVNHQRSFLVAYASLEDDAYKVVRLGRTQDLSDVWADGVDIGLDPDPSVSVGSGATAHIGIGVAEDGRIYATAVGQLAASFDGGETWRANLLGFLEGEFQSPTLIPVAGGMRMLTRVELASSDDESVVLDLSLGGPSSGALPWSEEGDPATVNAWLGLRDFSFETGVSGSDTGAGSISAFSSSGTMLLESTGGAATRTWTTASAADAFDADGRGALLRCRLRVNGPDGVYPASITLEGGGFGLRVEIAHNDVQTYRSVSSGGTDGYVDDASRSYTSQAWVELMIGAANGRGRVLMREEGDRPGLWHEVAAFEVEDNSSNGGTGLNQRLYVSSVDGWTQTVNWAWIGTQAPADEANLGIPMHSWIVGEKRPGRPFSLLGAALDRDVELVSTGDGVTLPGDEWSVSIARSYDLARTVDVSPRRRWQEAAHASTPGTRVIAWSWNSAQPVSDVLGIALLDTTLIEYDLELHVPGTGWVSYGTIDTQYTGPDFTAGAADSAQLTLGELVKRNELVGGWFVTQAGAAASADQRLQHRVLAHNGAGADAPIVLRLDGTPAANSDPEACRLAPASHVVLVSMQGSPVNGARITIPAGTDDTAPRPANDVHRLGSVLIGGFVPFAQAYSWGRVVEQRTNADVTTLRGGSRRSVRRGPPRRRVDVAWPDGVDTLNAWEGAQAPAAVDFDPAVGASPVAHHGSTVADLAGLLREVDGAHRPVVYVAGVEVLDGTEPQPLRVLRHRDRFVYGRLPDSIRFESVQGSETAGEVWRIATISIDEEV